MCDFRPISIRLHIGDPPQMLLRVDRTTGCRLSFPSIFVQYLNVVKVDFLEELFNATEANIEEIHGWLDWVERG